MLSMTWGIFQLDHYLIHLTSGDNEDGNEMTAPGVLDGNDVTEKVLQEGQELRDPAFDPLRFSGDNEDFSDQT